MDVIRVLIGGALVLLGRKLYWLFIAVLGFVLGFTLSGLFFPDLSELLMIFIGLLAGALGALAAIFLNQLAITLAGFLGGGLIAVQLLAFLGLDNSGFSWAPFIIGGIIGTILAAIFFDWILIIFSSLIGTFVIASAWDNLTLGLEVFLLILFVIGLAIQAIFYLREQKQ